MRIRGSIFLVSAIALTAMLFGCNRTPAPAGGGAAPPAGAANSQVHGTLGQVMKGILFPSSNVVFAAQNVNPNDVKPASDPALATDPLASSFGKWEAVENSGIAIAEAANLLTIPGRKCS